MHNFKQLTVWQKARELVKDIYRVTASFPSDEKFGITNQIRRASVSICANIAEGSGKGTLKDFNRFLDNALGSTFEVETFLILSSDLGFLKNPESESLVTKVEEIGKMLNGLKSKISQVEEPSEIYQTKMFWEKAEQNQNEFI